MSYLVVLIVDDVDDVPDILSRWEQMGVLGATIFESSGMGRMRRAGLLDNLPLMPSLRDLFAGEEKHHRTLLSVVDGQDMVDKMVAAAQEVIGNLEDPHTGFMFVLPVLQVYGMGRHRTNRAQE